MFTRRSKPVRIIGDPDNQRPDKWSSIVYYMDKNNATLKRSSKQLQLKEFVNFIVLHDTNTALAQWSWAPGLLYITFLATCFTLVEFPWCNSGSIKATKFCSKLATDILRSVLYGNRITRSKGTRHPSAVNMKGVGSPDMLVPVDQTARRHIQEGRDLGAPPPDSLKSHVGLLN